MVTQSRVGSQAVGGTVTTTSTSSGDPTKDPRTPGPPQTLTGSSLLEYTNGLYLASITLTWVTPSTATDGTPMSPTQIQVYRLAGTGTGTFALATVVDVPDHSVVLHGYQTDTDWQFKVRAIAANGKLSAFSNVLPQHAAGYAQGQAPPVTSPPNLSSDVCMVTVAWDGLASGGAAMPADFDHVLVQRAPNDTSWTTTAKVDVGSIFAGGHTVDGPFQQGSTQWYRFVPYSKLGVAGPPSVSQHVLVVGVSGVTGPGGDIVGGTINTDQMDATLAKNINDAITSTAGNAVPGAHIFTRATQPTIGPPDNAVPGDLWFDTSNNNEPRVLSGTSWPTYRDYVVSQAFSGAGNSISAPYLLPSVVQAQYLAAGVVSADVLIAKGTITAVNGIIGSIDAGVISAGYLSAQRIHADTLDSSLLVMADMTNLADEPAFDGRPPQIQDPAFAPPNLTPADPLHTIDAPTNTQPWPGVGWSDSRGATPPTAAGRKTIADMPVQLNPVPPVTPITGSATGGPGNVWSIKGNATMIDAVNKRTTAISGTDQFYGEVWVRRLASGTTGTAALALRVTYSAPPPLAQHNPIQAGDVIAIPGLTNTAWVILGAKTFIPSDQVTTWFKLTGQLVPPPPYKPPPDKTPQPGDQPFTMYYDVAQLKNATSITVALHVHSDVGAGATQEIQFAKPWVRYKNTANLVVDGTISANQLAAGSVTALEIKTGSVVADNIASGTITANEIVAHGLGVEVLKAGYLWSGIVAGDVFRTAGVTYKADALGNTLYPPQIISRIYPALEISTSGIFFMQDANNPLFQLGITPGSPPSFSMSWRSSASAIARWTIDNSGIRLADNAGNVTVSLMAIGGVGPSGTGPDGTTGTSYPAGSAFFKGNIFASNIDATNTITGATIQNRASGDPLIELASPGSTTDPLSSHLLMTDKWGGIMFRILADAGSTAAKIVIDSSPTPKSSYPSLGPPKQYPRIRLTSLDGLYFYDASGNLAVSLDAGTGDATFAGDLSGSTMTAVTITASNYLSSTTNPRVTIVNSGSGSTLSSTFQVTDQWGGIVVRFIADKTTSPAIVIDSSPTPKSTNIAVGPTAQYPRFRLHSVDGVFFYDKNGAAAVILDAKTGNASFAGNLDTSSMDSGTITSGTISGTTITGGLFQTSTGAPRISISDALGIRAYLTYNTYAFYVNQNGVAFFSGSIKASSVSADTTISGDSINAGTISGTNISGGTISGGTISAQKYIGIQTGFNASSPISSNPTFNGGGGTNTGTITGGVWRSANQANRVEIAGNAITIIANNSDGGYLQDYSQSSDILLWGASSTGAAWLGYNSSHGGGQFSFANNGSLHAYGLTWSTPITAIAGYAAVYCSTSTTSGYMGLYTSSVRHKKAVRPLALHPGFMNVEAATWADKPNIATVDVRVSHPGMPRRNTGFTAENLHKAGMSDSVTYDAHRRPNGIQQPAIMAHTVAYTQWLVRQVEALTARVAALEGAGA